MDLASFLGASYVGDTLAVPLMSFMHFMTSSYIQLTEEAAYQVASAFQIEEKAGLRERLQRNAEQKDFMIDIICFE
jgi:hypothetical protein